MHVLFVEPCFPSYQAKFVDALVEVGARVTGIGEVPSDRIPRDIRHKLYNYEQVGNVCNEGELFAAVRRCQSREWVDRLEATIEAHILPAARVREACGIPGTSVRTAYLCRDKPAMKDALRRAGVPCAASTGATTAAEVRDFVETVGLPIIIKPPDAAGAAGTFKCKTVEELNHAIKASGVDRGVPIAVEEFIEGHEGFYDTLCVDGGIVMDFASHYYPNVLHGMRTRWISPQVVTTNRVDVPGYYDQVRALGDMVNKALGIGTSATHMEYFIGPKGIKFSEIGCRPPGVGMWDVYCMANDFNIYREWAMTIVHRRIAEKPSRKYSAGMIAFRPDRDGRIVGYDGVDQVRARYGSYIVDGHFPPVGSGTQPVEGGFWANAWLRARHPDYDGLRAMLNDIGETIQVRAR